ncbi:MAG: type II secretion system protein [Thermodesulfobacteriota bacterium]|nr:type II secretion system protein [Thermodesulfobacteriota bacterium]
MILKSAFCRRPAGFTLLEVMIALAILSLVAVAFLRSQVSSVRLVDEASQISLATLLAKEKMAELESIGFSEPQKTSGTGGKEFPMFRWEQVVSLTEVLNLRKAQVRVFWMEGRQERSLELTAFFAKR